MSVEFTIPEGIKTIAAGAVFCKNLTSVYSPVSLTKIEPMAFSDCPNIVIVANPGTTAHNYAEMNKIRTCTPCTSK